MYEFKETSLYVMEKPFEKSNPLHNQHDKGYKYLLSSSKIFIELLKCFVNEGWAHKVDENSVVRIDKSFILHDFEEKESDLIYRLKVKDQEIIFYVLMELQSSVDFQMPCRLLLYMVEIWRSVLKDTPELKAKRKDFRLPVIVPCVLYNGENNWTVKPDFKEYLAGHEKFGEHALNFKYILIDVNRYSDDYLLELSNLIGSVFMLDKKIGASDELSNKLVRLINVLKNFTSEDMTLFKNWFKIISSKNLPPDDQKEIENILERERNVESMVYAIEKFMKEEFERQHESGKSEGIQEGIKEGIQKGIDKEAENSRQRSIKSVRNLLTKKFGSLSPEVIAKLESAESDGLLRIIDNIFDLESLDDALKLL